jgi:transposase
VYYGTNEYNFEWLENPPEYEPTRCARCNTVIVLSEGGFSMLGGEYFCGKCGGFEWPK